MKPIWLIASYPLATCLNLLLWIFLRRRFRTILIAGAAIPLITLIYLTFFLPGEIPPLISFPIIEIPGGESWNLAFTTEPPRLLLLLVLSLLCFLIQVYSLDYLGNSGSQSYFHFLLMVFQMVMAGLFLADNLFTLFVCWELVGLFSYLLIQFWYSEKKAIKSAFEVLVINKAGDLLLLGGIGLLCSFGLSFPVKDSLYFPEGSDVFLSSFTGKILCSFFMASAVIKSAQFPFSIWLKKAMAGPASVSALLHSATMVAAGVWLMSRLGPFFPQQVLEWLALTGIFTLMAGNLAAIGSSKLKSTLAFSTIAQLGLMMTAIGAGRFDEVTMHLVAHAFFKAALFLICGLLMKHLSEKGFPDDETQEYHNLSGILRNSVWARFCLGICLASLAGLPLTSGFISKEGLMPVIQQGSSPFEFLVFAAFQVGAFLTALYSGRIFFLLVFDNHQDPPDFAPRMAVPVVLLSILSTFLVFGWNPISSEGWLSRFAGLNGKTMSPDFFAAAGGLITAWFTRKNIYFHRLPVVLKSVFIEYRPIESLINTGSALLHKSAVFAGRMETGIFHTSENFVSRSVVVAGYFSSFTDRYLLDGILKATGSFFRYLGGMLIEQARHSARFAAWLTILVLILIIYFSYYR